MSMSRECPFDIFPDEEIRINFPTTKRRILQFFICKRQNKVNKLYIRCLPLPSKGYDDTYYDIKY